MKKSVLVVTLLLCGSVQAGGWQWKVKRWFIKEGIFDRSDREKATLLGNKEADPHIKEMVQEALREMGASNVNDVAIKELHTNSRMTGCGNSKTIWIDSSSLDLKFTCYHEAAHKACDHFNKKWRAERTSLVPVIAASAITCGLMPGILGKAIGTPIVLLAAWRIRRSMLGRQAWDQEKEADCKAIEVLCAKGEESSVKEALTAIEAYTRQGMLIYLRGLFGAEGSPEREPLVQNLMAQHFPRYLQDGIVEVEGPGCTGTLVELSRNGRPTNVERLKYMRAALNVAISKTHREHE